MTLKKANNNWRLCKARKGDFPPDACENISARRDMLRGVLITDCGLLLPITFLCCELQTGSKATNTSSDPGPVTRRRYRAAMVTGSLQISVHYRAQPHGKQMCNTCVNFVAALNACQRVDGRISATGWCDLDQKILNHYQFNPGRFTHARRLPAVHKPGLLQALSIPVPAQSTVTL